MELSKLFIFLLLKFVMCSTDYSTGFSPHMENVQHSESGGLREVWGLVEVRPGVHMFWWLYYTTHPDGYQNRPWIIWLQGGPGLSGSALGNFLEIGPFDKDFTPRKTTWLQEGSLLFIDNPADVGFSYLQNESLAAHDIQGISEDLMVFLQVFLQDFQDLKSVPLYLFGQSYGGKYVSHLGYTMQQKKDVGEFDINLHGIAIGNGLVSPPDFLFGYGTFLFEFGLIDDQSRDKYDEGMQKCSELIEQGKWKEALQSHFDAFNDLIENIPGVDLYNVYNHHNISGKQNKKRNTDGIWSPLYSIYDEDMDPFMNGPVKERLSLPYNIKWKDFRASAVWDSQLDDILKGTIYAVDWLLQHSEVEINIYEGQLDLMCQTAGAVSWINRLTWSGLSQFQSAKRRFLLDPDSGQTEMFVKSQDTLKFYWILNSGHAVPADTPDVALRMLRRILSNEDH